MGRFDLTKFILHGNVFLVGADVELINDRLREVHNYIDEHYRKNIVACLVDFKTFSTVEEHIFQSVVAKIEEIYGIQILATSLPELKRKIDEFCHGKRFVLNVVDVPDELSYIVYQSLMKMCNTRISFNMTLHRRYHLIPDNLFEKVYSIEL